MLVVLDAQGNLQKITPSLFYQGSNMANQIYIMLPLPSSVVVQARFRLPNGKVTKPITVPIDANTDFTGLTDANGNIVYVWSFSPQSALTAYAGTVEVQLEIFNGTQIITTFSFTFDVSDGVPPIDVPADPDSYQEVIAALQAYNRAISNNLDALQTQINEQQREKQEATDYALNTESKTVVGAINELLEDFQDIEIDINIPLKEGSGKDAVEQFQDQEAGVPEGFFNFRNKNENAIAKDPSLNTDIEYGATGDYSVAFGGKCAAQGKRSLAEGTTTIAKGAYSHAEGNNSVTLGANSHAEGKQTTTYGENAHAEGFGAYAEGYVSHAEGLNTHAQGACSHAEGNGCVATSDQSHAEGSGSQATGYSSHAEGENTFATNHASHAEGRGTYATQRSAHAEGETTYAEGICSHAEGLNTHAVGNCSHAEGEFSFANGHHSHAGGKDCIADYECDFVQGEGLSATLENQTVFGKYNDNTNWGNNRPVFMIGNGTSDSDRSNIFEIRQDGTIAIKYNGQKYSLQKILEALSAFSGSALLDD